MWIELMKILLVLIRTQFIDAMFGFNSTPSSAAPANYRTPYKTGLCTETILFFTNMISNRICLLKKRSGNSFEMMSFEPSRTFLNLAKFIFYSRCKHCLTIWWPLLDTRNSHALELGKLNWTKINSKKVIFIDKINSFEESIWICAR